MFLTIKVASKYSDISLGLTDVYYLDTNYVYIKKKICLSQTLDEA
jgi:hypothetical protein